MMYRDADDWDRQLLKQDMVKAGLSQEEVEYGEKLMRDLCGIDYYTLSEIINNLIKKFINERK